ncbi:MAG TPA: hypothetical protein G4N98_05280 [Thermoflexia bacterium]|nr:hypothetical protein [Thermoflexia bacterium]
MIESFASKETKKIFPGKVSRKLPLDIQRTVRRKLLYLDDAEDLRAPPGNRLEKLRGDRAGQYSLIAYEFGSDCARQNIRYAEVTFTIATNTKFNGLDWQVILEGLNAGRAQARAEFGVDWGWVFDICRGDNPETQDDVIEIALAARD